MRNLTLINILHDLGLTENEATVYLASLSLGPTTILKIAQAAEIKRTTVYSVIDSLKMRGLMAIEVKGFKKLFVPENPDKLGSVLENRKEALSKVLPEFAALYNLKGNESTIRYYEGLEGIKSAYESMIRDVRPKEDYCIISYIDPWLSADKEFFLGFTKRRAKLNINIRLLLLDSPVAREHKKLEKVFNEKIKFLPVGTMLATNTVITPERLILHQLTPPLMAIAIENQSIIKMHKELFEIIWRSIPE